MQKLQLRPLKLFQSTSPRDNVEAKLKAAVGLDLNDVVKQCRLKRSPTKAKTLRTIPSADSLASREKRLYQTVLVTSSELNG